MTLHRQYNSGPALRTALEERLRKCSREEAVDLQRLRRQVTFDRFLVRLVSGDRSDWVLKRGYAMELRFQMARATRDLDFGAPAGKLVRSSSAPLPAPPHTAPSNTSNGDGTAPPPK